MIRSTLMALLVAAVLAVSPASASAVTAGGALTISDTNPSVNETFTAVVDAGTCEQVTLTVEAPDGSVTIDGDQTTEATKDVSGDTVSFDVSIAVEGTFRLVSVCVAGAPVEGGYAANDGAGAAEVVVGGDVIAPVEGGGGGGILPAAGADQLTTVLAAGGLVLLLGGGLLLARRRRAASHSG